MIVQEALVQLGVAGATLFVLNQTLTKLLPSILKMAMRPVEEILSGMSSVIGELTTELRATRADHQTARIEQQNEFERTTRIVERIETKIDMQYDLTPSPQDLPRVLSRSKNKR